MTVLFLWSTDHSFRDQPGSNDEQLLSADELERADRFQFPRLRNRFVAGRSWLRRTLAIFLDVDAQQIEFVTSDLGKPSILQPSCCPLEFSYSRSQNYSVCAVSMDRQVGVDIESIQPIETIVSTAGTIFCSQDFLTWSRLGHRQLEAFYRAWTRKESVGKSTGTGISTGPENISVPLKDFDSGLGTTVQYQNCSIGISDWSPFAGTMASAAIARIPCGSSTFSYGDDVFMAGEQFEIEHACMSRVPNGSTLLVRNINFSAQEGLK